MKKWKIAFIAKDNWPGNDVLILNEDELRQAIKQHMSELYYEIEDLEIEELSDAAGS